MILKLKLTPAIYLVGFMGCGKSTAGRALAEELGWPFFDLDDEIEKHAGTSITAIFKDQGELAFRALETEALRRRIAVARTGRPQVISLGGGAFTEPRNCELANANGVTIWLDAPLAVIAQRITYETHRPLAQDPEKWLALYEIRREAYALADYRIETGDGSVDAVVKQILALPIFVP
jgi:shikimate kinase